MHATLLLLFVFSGTEARAVLNGTAFSDTLPTVVMPPGCECQTYGKTVFQCTSFNCNCPCDLSPQTCDLNCCCDRDCTEIEKKQFEKCVEESKERKTDEDIRMCSDSKVAIENIRSNFPNKVEETMQDALGDFVCVTKINSPSKGNFFINQDYSLASNIFAQYGLGSRRYNYDLQDMDPSEEILTEHNSFQIGDLIPVFYDKNSESNEKDGSTLFRSIFEGVFRLPSKGDNLLCNDENVLEFGIDVKKSQCLRAFLNKNDLELLCNTSLNSKNLVSNIFVGSNIYKSSKAYDEGDILDIKYRSFVDKDGGTIDVINETVTHTEWNDASSRCNNALQKLSYAFFYDELGAIINILAHVKMQDVEVSSKGMYQEFSAHFIHSSIINDISNLQSAHIQKRSGNPGYLPRSPILSGNYTGHDNNSSRAHITLSKKGLTIMDNGLGGDCDTVKRDGTIVTFGEDIIVGCTKKMTRAEIQNMCRASSPTSDLSSIFKAESSKTIMIPTWLEPTFELVGVFGNADITDVGQWLHADSPITNPDYLIKDRGWIPSEGRCDGLPSKVHYKFLWTKVGNVNTPQNKIMGVEIEFDDKVSLKHILRPHEKQNFMFFTTVTWIESKSASEVEIPPPPTLLPKLPDDFFYPFTIGSITSGSSSKEINLGIFYFQVMLISWSISFCLI